ncbi:hypothetical protein EJ04DRAFT_580415 [Polyplosphaeria fusca]|uniref:Zn(2)-C6 fungal-type domain-containing protein n=1 Tax=Polyplosphaeria fusca TaxID=682080 RepID=A0A9P4QLW7_9PLEO|nr:hypothetical protein EJ04DRAFT_580415 [Polyplosphaeria fusca]
MNRATYACARCFKQKRKCDSRSPACSRCLAAGVECVGLDRATATPVPRSLAQYLEQRIESLESEVESMTAHGSGDQHPRPPQTSFEQDIHHFVADLASNSNDANSSAPDLFSSLVAKSLSTPSPIPDVLVGPTHQLEATPRDSSRVTTIELMSIPSHVAEVLVKVYVDKILPQYPYFYVEQIWVHFKTVYDNVQSIALAHSSHFIIALIMAVSTMTSKAAEFEKPMAFSDALYHGAMKHYEALQPNTLETLQATILVCQFATFRPATANIWRARDIAMRMAIALGLHRKPNPRWHSMKPETEILRAQVFWVIYAMDRSFGVPPMRPLGITDDQIDVEFPEHNENDLPNEDTYSSRRKIQWLNHVRLRQLQSEVYDINFGTAEIPFGSYQIWMSDMDSRLQSWKQEATIMPETGPDWFDFVMSTVQFYLHQPCPRNPTPKDIDRVVCFEAASTSLHGYYGLMQTGFLKFDWHSSNQCFPNSMFILDNAAFFVNALSLGRVVSLLDKYAECFTLLSKRWPATAVLCTKFEERRSLFQSSLFSSSLVGDLSQTLGMTTQNQADIMEAIHAYAGPEFPAFDDTTYWGVDEYPQFMDLDWSTVGLYDDMVL